ncbi:MAG: hypothetical protein JF614_08030 [Acidobacteria bacterium]|nr:hypothetical protein [Acidobacteriota bacterium]
MTPPPRQLRLNVCSDEPDWHQAVKTEAALAMDRLRRQIGPVGVPVSELIGEGRRR